MAIQTRDYLKSKFETGDKPQAQDFADWIDSFVHLNDHSPVVQIPAGGGNIVIADGELLEKMVIISASAQNIDVGTTPGGTEVIDGSAIAAGGYLVHTENFYANGSPVTLYFTSANAITVKIKKTVFA